ncbi:MAG: DUF559 domain-containing protein [Bacteroidota bacterium]|nr:MAG: DUF559 domain-containing protein [Bacteroidota bacterium]
MDGDSHYSEEAYKKDVLRQKRLESLGISFLRFDDIEVKHNIHNVLRTIESCIDEFVEVTHP